jgi:hypothetical protein
MTIMHHGNKTKLMISSLDYDEINSHNCGFDVEMCFRFMLNVIIIWI